MVDRAQRDTAARILRSFVDGTITNEEFEKQFPRGEDDSAAGGPPFDAAQAQAVCLYGCRRVAQPSTPPIRFLKGAAFDLTDLPAIVSSLP